MLIKDKEPRRDEDASGRKKVISCTSFTGTNLKLLVNNYIKDSPPREFRIIKAKFVARTCTYRERHELYGRKVMGKDCLLFVEKNR